MLSSFDEEKNVGFAKALQLCLTEVTRTSVVKRRSEPRALWCKGSALFYILKKNLEMGGNVLCLSENSHRDCLV
jgi:hypothetical protein